VGKLDREIEGLFRGGTKIKKKLSREGGADCLYKKKGFMDPFFVETGGGCFICREVGGG